MNTYLLIKDHEEVSKTKLYFETGPLYAVTPPRVGDRLTVKDGTVEEQGTYVVRSVRWELFQHGEQEMHCIVMVWKE